MHNQSPKDETDGLPTADTLEERIFDYIRKKSGVSFAELARDVKGFRGDETWGSGDSNVVIWTGMSVAAIVAMQALIRADKIIPTVSDLLVYAFDGSILDLPIAKSTRKKYAKPHWLPTVFAGNRASA